MNFSIPDDLKARMDTVDGVNWSALAREAFNRKLVQINARKDDPTMEDVAARLRSTRAQTAEKGKALGRAWATTDATEDELEALETHSAKVDAWTALSLDHVFMMVARWDRDENGCCVSEAIEWWDGVGGHKDPSDVTLRGFIDGALEVYNEVKPLL